MTPLLLANAAVTTLVAGLFVGVGLLVLKRRAPGVAGLATRAFAAWWFAAGVVFLLNAAPHALASYGVVDSPLQTALVLLRPLPLSVALGALAFYLAYLYTGNARLLAPVGVAAGAFFAFTMAYFAFLLPFRFEAQEWVLVATPAPHDARLDSLFGAAVSLPILGMAVAYGSLYWRTPDPLVRYRVALTTLGFVAWFAAILVAFAVHLDRSPYFPLAWELPGVFAAACALLAQRPPARVVRRLAAARPE